MQSRLGNFLTSAQRASDLHGLVCQVFELTSLFVASEQGVIDQALVDATEQVLIHLMGRSVLLNSQPGGFYRQYMPEDEDLNDSGAADDLKILSIYFRNVLVPEPEEQQLPMVVNHNVQEIDGNIQQVFM